MEPVCCVYCDAPGAQRVVCKSSQVQAWSCRGCGGRWWFTAVNPPVRAFLEQLAEDVAARAVLREVIALRELAPTLTDGQLRTRLIGCLARLDQVCRYG